MTWTKLSDDFSDDCWELSDAAYRLHVEGLNWSNRKLLDCRLPKDEVRRWAKRPEAVGELVACGWWSDEGDHYTIRHHACYQRTAEQVLAQQERSRENGKNGGRPPGPPRERAPRKRQETQWLTQTGTQMGSEDEAQNPRPKPSRVTQLPTHRDWPGEGEVTTKPGTCTSSNARENGQRQTAAGSCRNGCAHPVMRDGLCGACLGRELQR